MEGDERRSRSVKRSSLGIPKCTPNKYSRRLKRLSLGMPPMHPLLHQQSSVCPSLHYIFITSCVMCYAWSVSLFTFQFALALLAGHIFWDIIIDWEKHAPLKLEHLIGFSCLSFAMSCSLSFLSCCPVQLQCFSFLLELLFCLRLNFLQVACFILFREFACCTEFCVLTRKQIVELLFSLQQ